MFDDSIVAVENNKLLSIADNNNNINKCYIPSHREQVRRNKIRINNKIDGALKNKRK